MTLGEKLKKLRNERRMSLNDASRLTRIQVKYLECLEEGNCDKLPADVYVKGFLKSYAEVLGVEDKILIRLYDKEREIKKNLEKRKSDNQKNTLGQLARVEKAVNVSSFVVTPKIVVASISILLVFGGFFYLYKEIGSFASVPRLIILNPENNYVTDTNSISVEGITDKDSTVYLNEQPILVQDDGKFRENVNLQSGTNVINIKTVNKFDKISEKTVTIQSSYQPEKQFSNTVSDLEEAGKNAENREGLEAEIKVDPGPVWVSVEVDGNLIFSGTMLTGATQSFQAKEKIVINSGKANATFVKFNGKDIGALGKDGAAIRGVTFTPDTKY